jgi:aspartate/tyrosine/aromatic aminotransferase
MTQFHIYFAPGGRINISGVRPDKAEYLAAAILEVTLEY